jgi:hypothetical protein
MGETGLAHIVVITWDASVHGWGAVIRWWANRDGKVIVGSLPSSPDMLHQVRREALAGVLAFEAADRLIDLSDATVILRNDAVGALAAFRKGSFSSTFLQQCSMRLAHAMSPRRASLLCLHAPGLVLIDEGVDDLSRDATIDVTGPVTDPGLHLHINSLLTHCRWDITVDVFASTDNALTPRFFARYAEPAAEFEDAFTVPDWAVSLCPHCGSHHREVLYAFPPTALINRFVAKASADGVRAIVVVPLAVSAPYWNKLLRFSITPNADGFLRSRRHQSAPPNSAASLDLAIFAVDFSSAQLRVRSHHTTSPCGSESTFRGRHPAGSPHDQLERARIHDAIRDLCTTLRPPTATHT